MATDPADALDRLVDALRDHLRAATSLQDPDADDVLDAAADVADAFDAYDEALFDATGVDTPLGVFEGEDDEDDEDDDDDPEDAVDPDDEDDDAVAPTPVV